MRLREVKHLFHEYLKYLVKLVDYISQIITETK